MNHEQLNIFIKVMELGSFNKASEFLYLTPSTVMRHINRLEEEVGFKLLERSSKGMRPTSAGEFYYQEILRWNNEYDKIVGNAREMALNLEVHGTIRVGTHREFPEMFVKKYLRKIQKTFPNVRFEFISYGIYSDSIMKMIKDVGDKIDIIFENYEMQAVREYNLEVIHLCDNPVSCAVSINSELYFEEKLQMEDLYGRTVSIWDHKRSSVDADMRKIFSLYPEIKVKDIPIQDETAFDVNDNEIILGYPIWEGILPFYKWIPLEIDYKIPYGIVYHKDPSPKVKMFIERINEIEF